MRSDRSEKISTRLYARQTRDSANSLTTLPRFRKRTKVEGSKAYRQSETNKVDVLSDRYGIY
jgi:hypothetical protein